MIRYANSTEIRDAVDALGIPGFDILKREYDKPISVEDLVRNRVFMESIKMPRRRMQVFAALFTVMNERDAAESLTMSVSSFREHRTKILRTYGVKSRHALMGKIIKMALVGSGA